MFYAHLKSTYRLNLTSSIVSRTGFFVRVPTRSIVLYQKVKSTITNKSVPSTFNNKVSPPEKPVIDPKAEAKHKRRSLLVGGIVFTGLVLFLSRYFRLPDDNSKSRKKENELQRVKVPLDSDKIPKKIQYLLIGGGTASFSAFRAIKTADPTAKVLVVTDEHFYPYMRPPLSKEMWFQINENIKNLRFKQWNGTERSLFFEPDEFYIACENLENEPKGGIAVARGWKVVRVDPERKIAILDDGSNIQYEKCLLATGVKPKNLAVFENSDEKIRDKVTLFRNIEDFKRLHQLINDGVKSITIIGGSFLGSELACALSRNGNSGIKVTQAYPEKGNLGKILPDYLSAWTTDRIRTQGIEIIPNVDVDNASLSPNSKQIEITLSNGQKLSSDHAIIAIGSEANTDLAKSSGLEVHSELGGFLVNSELAVRTDLYAAGDCACFYDPQLGRRRIEHHDHAVTSGRLAGENMTGTHKAYAHQSMFWSDLGPDIGFEAVGVVDPTLPTVGIFAESSEKISEDNSESKNDKKEQEISSATNIRTSLPKAGVNYSKGVVFYLKDDFIVGIVLWNVFSRSGIAKQVLKERKKLDLNEVAKLFHIHEDDDD